MNYKVIYDEKENAEVIFINGENIDKQPLGNVSGLSPLEVDKLAQQVISANITVPIPHIEQDLYEDIKSDIDLGRVQMRKVMKLMASKDLSIKDKNEMVEVCKVEIASALTLGKLLKQRIELECAYGKDKKNQK